MSWSARIGGLLLIITSVLSAHDHWLETESGLYAVGDTISIHLRSGHEFKWGKFVIAKDMIHEAYIHQPNGVHLPLELNSSERELIAQFSSPQSGVHNIIVKIRKRGSGPSDYILKLRILIGKEPMFQDTLVSGELDLILFDSDKKLQTFKDSAPVHSPIVLTGKNHRRMALNMDREGFSTLPNSLEGYQVATARYGRQTISYAFFLEEE